ncbi:GDSL-type esterase/lipase family protein [Aeoliella sp. SH292]|uniref:GDSL-type esterase/lipase family protein n=1 Tax=Aeoliella sp. SH292 TaxID=3454464 RepID=UPI003F983AF6
MWFRANGFVALAVAGLLVGSGGPAVGQGGSLIANLERGENQTVVIYGTSLTAGGAWGSQVRSFLDTQYPGKVTWVNSGMSGRASNSGVANLNDRVLAHQPDAVFIEFGMNDAFTDYAVGDIDKDISLTEARTNLESMIASIQSQNENAQIVLQTMNPAWNAPNGNGSATKRPQLADYYQVYRDVAGEQSLALVDNNRVWLKVQSNDSAEFQARVSDGTHPDATGYKRYVSSAVLYELGAPTGPTLVVDLESGETYLHNQSKASVELISYSITSTTGALLDDWSGLAALEAGTWEKANPTSNALSELAGSSSMTIAAGQVLDLGVAWDAAKSPNLAFRYQTVNGVLRDGHLVFLEDTSRLTAVAGDFNGDGVVNLADYTVWRDNLGTASESAINHAGDGVAGVDASDYQIWKSNFGAGGAATVSSVNVPEPTSAVLMVGLLGMVLHFMHSTKSVE